MKQSLTIREYSKAISLRYSWQIFLNEYLKEYPLNAFELIKDVKDLDNLSKDELTELMKSKAEEKRLEIEKEARAMFFELERGNELFTIMSEKVWTETEDGADYMKEVERVFPFFMGLLTE